jgi:hypothetical protein
MDGRSVLGPVDVTEAELASMVAEWMGLCREEVSVLGSRCEVVEYDLPAITTAGRYWVSGTAATPDGTLPFRFFVKHVQSWSRSPLFDAVPPEYRAFAESSVPWRTEPLIYRSDLVDRLPEGLTMPRAVAVREVDELSAAVWLEEVPTDAASWSVEDFANAAHLLGRLAASARVRPLAAVGEGDRRRTVRDYADGRLAVQVIPMLRDDDLWAHPVLVAGFDEAVRARLLGQVERVEGYVTELESVPLGTAHGDACPNNILRTAGSPDLVLIDFGFWSTQPLGFDLGQLLLGDVQIGRREASTLGEVESAILPAYVRGLHDEGATVDEPTVRRAHALHMLVFNALSSLPVELLDREPTPEVVSRARERAAMATFVLDLLDGTTPLPLARGEDRGTVDGESS